MRIGLRHDAFETVDWLKARLAAGDCTRTFLARGLCEREGWRNAKGELCLASARAALPKLSSAIGLPLPEARPMGAVSAESLVPAPGFADRVLSCPLDDLGALEVVPVTDAERGLARSMMATHHPRGDAGCPGGRIRCWIRSPSHGVLGGFTVGAASWHHRARDLDIGWSQAVRDANIGRKVNNDRFLLLAGGRVRGLAALALSLLAARWREALDRVPERAMGGGPPLEAGEDATWAQTEYGRSGHSDARVCAPGQDGRGLVRTSARPGAPLPVIFPGEAEQRAAYRFLSNPRLGVQDILEPHQEAMVERCRSRPVVLAVQDTTMLNDSGLEAPAPAAGGIAAHAGVAFSEGGCALGVFSSMPASAPSTGAKRSRARRAGAGETPSPRPPARARPCGSSCGQASSTWSRPPACRRARRPCACSPCACWNPTRRTAGSRSTGCC